MQTKSHPVVGILLCAGRGRRFDPSGQQDKLLQVLPSGERVAEASARHLRQACGRVVAVLRPESPALRQVLLDSGCEVLECADADLGMSATLRAGLAHTREAPAWLIALADMPHVRADSYQALLRGLASGARAVLPLYEGQRGNPVGFSAACLPELMALQGDQGARSLLAGDDVLRVTLDDPGVLRDIDTPADLQQG